MGVALSDNPIEDKIMELVDAFGPDFIQLAPPDEDHFDPVLIAEMLASGVLGAIGAGIAAGIKEWSKDKTLDVLNAVEAQITRRLPAAVKRPFSAEQTEETRADAERQAALEIASARRATTALGGTTADMVVTISVTTTMTSLEQLGLHETVSDRVRDELQNQLTAVLRLPD
jgi:hypothetical protein